MGLVGLGAAGCEDVISVFFHSFIGSIINILGWRESCIIRHYADRGIRSHGSKSKLPNMLYIYEAMGNGLPILWNYKNSRS